MRATITLEARLDDYGVPRQPRATVLPGLALPPGAPATVRLECPECGRLDDWHFNQARAAIVCGCQLRAAREVGR